MVSMKIAYTVLYNILSKFMQNINEQNWSIS